MPVARLQKSFFDQDAKHHSQWHNQKAFANESHPPASKSSVAMPPITASSQSRKKLKVFRFDKENTAPASNNGHNGLNTTGKESINTYKSEGFQDLPTTAPSQHLPLISNRVESRDCPQTPVGRLPLAELIASGEDLSQTLNLTPVERVLWDNSARNSEHGSSQETPVLPKNRKRARSSSPISSSQKKYKKSHRFSREERAADLQKAMKTPQGDPASDLWKKYSLNTSNNERLSPTRLFGQPFSQLVDSSSPQTPASRLWGRENAGLQRSFSCGAEWPTSAAKRRKLLPICSDQEVAAALGETDEGLHRSQKSKSKLSLLVAKISGDLARPADHGGGERNASSCKSPGRRESKVFADHRQVLVTAVRQHEDDMDQVQSPASDQTMTACKGLDKRGVLIVAPMQDRRHAKEVDDLSDDFGDEDLDIEMLNAIDADEDGPGFVIGVNGAQGVHREKSTVPTTIAANAEMSANNHEKAVLHELADRSTKPSASTSKGMTTAAITAVQAEHKDEFDEGSIDISADDLEDAIAIYDEKAKPGLQQNVVSNRPQGSDASQKQSTVYGSSPEDPQVVSVVRKSDHSDRAALSEDDFGVDAEFDDFAAECDEATQGHPSASPVLSSSERRCSIVQRYVIQTVAEDYYVTDEEHRRPEKILLVEDESTKLSKVITLRQSWVDSPCTPGSYVTVIGHFDRAGQCIVDDAQNLLILHPDYLISATVVADSFSCTRRAVLQERVKATGDASQPQIYGSILHEIFQEAMKANRWDTEWLGETIKSISARYLEQLFEINIEAENAVNHLQSRTTELQAWAEVFVAAKPNAKAVIKDRNGGSSLMSVNKLLEVEEKIWSPRYGLKGNIDATVQVAMHDGHGARTLTVPLELKTGKNSTAAHRAQTALYTLLCSDRYDVEIACGILYYMDSSETSRVPAVRHELIHMIKQRNELAGFVRYRHELPPILKRSPHLCGKCYAQTVCFIYHKLVDNGNGDAIGLGDIFDDLVKHLKPSHRDFFLKWDDLLTKEEKDIVKVRREVWTMQSSERERLGRCFSGVIIEPGSFCEVQEASKINRYRYSFTKKKPARAFTFRESQIALGEPIVISDERGHFALASGYVTSIQNNVLQVTVDRRLHNARTRGRQFDSLRHQSFIGIMEIVQSGTGQSTLTPTQPEDEVIYRIDKDEFSNGMATIRNNLIHIMEKDVFNSQPLRRLIVENATPTFRNTSSPYGLDESASQASLNIDQRAAIEKVMSAKDYALVLGMPGTGKTTTIAHIIRALTAQGKSVLLTSYTHTAVDNILLKIRKDNIGIFRLGAIAKVHPEVQEFADLGGVPIKTVEELKRAYSQQVVATTCLGINHPIFSQRIFDYCIVDEASQITLPVCLGPLRMARTFILVGDHNQLPPLVQNHEAQEGGLDISLFKTLSDSHPSSVINLEHQYRMCADIMLLSNTLIYSGRLKCGTVTVANRSITIPNIDALRLHHHSPSSILSSMNPTRICLNALNGPCWLRDLLAPTRKACFVNTDPLVPASREAESGSRITNPFEATLCAQLVEALTTTGVPQSDIGVITLYRSQLALIKHSLRHRPAVEMHTADRFQGRDKEVVVLSLVRSNENQNVGELLRDWRRVNVAFTRARTKLLVLGSRRTLEGNALLKDFTSLMDTKGWRYDLPSGALEGHVFNVEGTQLSGMVQEGIVLEHGRGEIDSGVVKAKGKENVGAKGKKVPMKTGKVDIKTLLSKRPVLKDIVNEAA